MGRALRKKMSTRCGRCGKRKARGFKYCKKCNVGESWTKRTKKKIDRVKEVQHRLDKATSPKKRAILIKELHKAANR